MIAEDDFFDYDHLMSLPYSKEGWVVMPLKKPPIDKDLNDFIEKMRLSNMGVPYCWHCWEELQLNENNDIYCPNCGLVIEVKK